MAKNKPSLFQKIQAVKKFLLEITLLSVLFIDLARFLIYVLKH